MLEPRYWFNPELESRRALIPGAIAIVMTIIGTMLTALVVAREWERGTMEAVLSTPASVAEILIGKLLPYFVLGMLSTLGAAALAVFVFGVPMRGSLAALLLLSAVFMVPALGQGLLISSLARNQFLAAQIALFTGFLPAFMLSGFLYEIDAMPAPIRAITRAGSGALLRRFAEDGVPGRRHLGRVPAQPGGHGGDRGAVLRDRQARHAQEPGVTRC
jgi:ABC-2 type transport system permease protein